MKKIISIILTAMFILSACAYSVVAEDEVVHSDMEIDKDSIVYDSYIRGDANRDEKINLEDAVLIMKQCANWTNLDIDLGAADANEDEVVNLADVIYILKIAAWH